MKKILISFIFIVAVLFVPELVKADLGPKPTMKFKFVSDNEFKITEGQQIECEDSECKNSNPLTEAGPQGFSCETNSCSSMAYGYSPYHKLSLKINGKKMESNIFETKGSNPTYTVYISGDSLSVGSLPANKDVVVKNLLSETATALLITLGIELIILILAIAIFKFPWKILIPFLIANVTSVPALWFFTGWFSLTTLSFVLAGEIIIVFYEALIYWLFLRKEYVYGKMFALSFALNLISFIATMFIKI